jgi:hypothetical protein
LDQFDHVDDVDVLEKAKTNGALSAALRLLWPENWHGCGLRPEEILPVAVGEPLALWASVPRVQMFESDQAEQEWEANREKRKYRLAKLELEAAGPGPPRAVKAHRKALIAPIPRFFTPFHGKQDEKIPDTVSRHATVHQPTVEHLSRKNALLALILCVSLLRQQQDWAEEIRNYDA